MQPGTGTKFVLLEKFGSIDVLGTGGSGNPTADRVLRSSFGMKPVAAQLRKYYWRREHFDHHLAM